MGHYNVWLGTAECRSLCVNAGLIVKNEYLCLTNCIVTST
jgi:hypothetical protein